MKQHLNPRFNILQATGNCNPNFVVFQGQRTDSGNMATGGVVLTGEMSRDAAIAAADKLEAETPLPLTRAQQLALIYRHTHADFKGKNADMGKTILVSRNGTTLVSLEHLTDAEIADKLPSALRQEEKRLAKIAAKTATKATKQVQDDAVIARAINILEQRMATYDVKLGSPDSAKNYLRCHLGQRENEVFTVLFLNVKNNLIAREDMFQGTLTHTSVYPREVVKAALRHNAASVMLAHNHPSGETTPSEADLLLTNALKAALGVVDIRVLDHFIVAGASAPYSFAEHGQL